MPGRTETSLQGELSRSFREAWGSFKREMQERLAALGLSNLQARALRELDVPLTMRQLADTIGTEPSNLTAVVDRMEASGLVQRRLRPGDRRIRELCLTPLGADTKARLGAEVFGRMALFDRLTLDEQHDLLALLDKLAAPPARPSGQRAHMKNTETATHRDRATSVSPSEK